MIDDVGSGVLADLDWLLGDEPSIARSIAAGAALVCCSGDKLLGGPQAGLLVGPADAVARARASTRWRGRCESTSSRWRRWRPRCACTATRRARRGRSPCSRCSSRRSTSWQRGRQRLRDLIGRSALRSSAASPRSAAGRFRCSSSRARRSRCELDAGRGDDRGALRHGEPPVICRIHDGRVLLDPRTLREERARASRPPRARRRAGMSASPLTLGTAGHIDHGKTALIRALTGVDTDRLPEEKARGISIELGYAQPRAAFRPAAVAGRRARATSDSSERWSPGASGIDMFLMAIAADDGVMPQTREHAVVLSALGIDAGVVAVTKSDLADPELAMLEASELLPGVETVAGVRPDRRGAGRAAATRSTALAAAVDEPGRERRADQAAHRPRVHDSRRRHRRHRDAVVRRDRPRRRADAAAAGAPGASAWGPGSRPAA